MEHIFALFTPSLVFLVTDIARLNGATVHKFSIRDVTNAKELHKVR
jgi:hypothetical protein